jgi:Zn-dependent oligopeptidase
VIRTSVVLLLLAIQAAPAAAQALPAWPRDAASVSAACASAVGELDRRVDGVAGRSGGFTFDNTVLPLENALSDAVDRTAAERFAWTFAQDDAIVDASRACRTSLRQAMIDVFANRRLYVAVSRVANHPPHAAFDRALTQTWQDRLERGGGTLGGTRHDRYVSYAHELAGVEDAFWRNLARDRTTIRIDRRQARGLPSDMLAAFARNRDGSWVVPVDDGTRPFLRFESDADARQAFYRAYNRRAAAANVPLLERAIALRDRMAHALGIESWAEYRLRSTAFGGYVKAEQFLTSAAAAYAPGRPPDGTAPWDLERSDASGSLAAAREIDDALSAIGTAFGLQFTRNVQGVWAPGVERYDVTDASSQRFLGTICVDLLRRPGKQTGEGAYAILRPRATHPGVVAIVASWPGRSGTIPPDRLVDFYRLAGRGIALLSPAVPYEMLARVSPAAQETASAIFERFARADAPPARTMLEQTALARVDLAFSSSGSHVDTSAVWQRVATATFAPLYDPGTYPQVATDEFAGADAGVVVLELRSQTYAADLYGALAVDGRFDPAAGERFRRTVLAPGATRRFEDEMHDFLGRDPRAVMP